MKRLAEIIWGEPVITLSVATGVTGVLAQQGIVAAWIPLVTLAVVTPIQRALVKPKRG